MKNECRKNGNNGEYFKKVTPMERIQKMERHSDAIIESAEKQKAELLEFAQWHRMRAAELQGF